MAWSTSPIARVRLAPKRSITGPARTPATSWPADETATTRPEVPSEKPRTLWR